MRPDPGTPLDKLSPREKEIVTRIARGESTRQMSFAMSVTAETVRTYVKNVLAKLGAHSRLQLAALASRDGWLIDQDTGRRTVLVPAGQPITWSHGGSLLQNGSWQVTLTQVGPSVPPQIHLLIVDQQRTFRDALAIRLRAEPDLVVAAEAQSTESARRVLAGRSTDVILLDAELPDDSGVAFCAEMTRRVPAPRVVMLSAASEAQRIVAAVRAGAAAWVRKDESIDSSPARYPRRRPRRDLAAARGARPGAAPADR